MSGFFIAAARGYLISRQLPLALLNYLL